MQHHNLQPPILHSPEALPATFGNTGIPARVGALVGHVFLPDSSTGVVAELAEVEDRTIRDEISQHSLMQSIPAERQEAATEKTFELYKVAKQNVAPVVTDFADHLLHESGGHQIIFAARDGLGTYTAATRLRDKFAYPGDDPEQLKYVYLTRKVVWGTGEPQLHKYLDEQGIHDQGARILMADIGMYGSMLPDIKRILPRVEAHYLISVNPHIPGYASHPMRPMKSMGRVPGNPAVHFLEDTFSGPTQSPSRLMEVDGVLVPDAHTNGFPPEELLRREYALRAIADYASELLSPPSQALRTAHITRLDNLLSRPEAFTSLMVPHAR